MAASTGLQLAFTCPSPCRAEANNTSGQEPRASLGEGPFSRVGLGRALKCGPVWCCRGHCHQLKVQEVKLQHIYGWLKFYLQLRMLSFGFSTQSFAAGHFRRCSLQKYAFHIISVYSSLAGVALCTHMLQGGGHNTELPKPCLTLGRGQPCIAVTVLRPLLEAVNPSPNLAGWQGG